MIEQTWAEARADVQKVNPELAKLIDEIHPPKDCYFLRAHYRYGDEILKQGAFFVPEKNGRGLIPFTSSTVDAKLYEAFGYNSGTNPLCLVLQKNLEQFMRLENRVIPFQILGPGSLFGLWRLMDHTSISHASIYLWDMTAGARSIFMLPKVAETLSHARLKKEFRFAHGKPVSMLEHWEIFRKITEGSSSQHPWQTELLLFSKGWLDRLNDPAWLKLRYYLLEQTWQKSSFWRNQFTWNLTFSRIQAMHRLKPPTHVDHSVQHMFVVASGAVPGFQPALTEDLAPIHCLQEAYVNIYQLKSYAPILMQPAYFNMYDPTQTPVYLSLHYATAIEFTYKVSERSSTIIDLSDCQSLTQAYLKEMTADTLHLGCTPLGEVASKVQFDFFHAESGHHAFIQESTDLLKADPNFMKSYSEDPTREFPKNSSFVKGCIRIAKKET